MKLGGLEYFWVFLSLAFLWVFYIYAKRKQQKSLEMFAEEKLISKLIYNQDITRNRIRTIFAFGAMLFICLSFLQPMWGFHWEEVKRKGLDIVIAVDLSKSMMAQDLKPSRLERAQLEIKNLINLLEGDRIGLVGFAGTAFLHCPLTLDYGSAKVFLDALDTNLLPMPGTDITLAIDRSIQAFEGVEKKHRVLILITDGEDHSGDVMGKVAEAKSKGIIIYTINVGTKVGAPIPVLDEKGRSSYLKDRQGNIVISKSDGELLQKIALNTGGQMGDLLSPFSPLEEIYQNEISKMEKRELQSTRQKKFENRYQFPLLIALILLVFEFAFVNRFRRPVE